MDAGKKHPPFKNITQIIDNDLRGYCELSDILAEERQVLVNRDFNTFTDLLSKKQKLITALEQNNRQRCQLLIECQLPVNKSGIESLMAKLPETESKKTRDNWLLVNEIIDQCTHYNEINARIAHRAQATNHQILNMLHGEPARFELYGKNGVPKDLPHPLPIAKV